MGKKKGKRDKKRNALEISLLWRECFISIMMDKVVAKALSEGPSQFDPRTMMSLEDKERKKKMVTIENRI